MKKINFITNLSLAENSGGGSAVNYATFHQLKRFFEVTYQGPVQVPVNRAAHVVSKLMRLSGLKGSYFFYSDNRLQKIADEVNQVIDKSDAEYNFFHGFTPWVRYKNERPYFAYADACFATYVTIYNNVFEFSNKSLTRIYELEKEWLQKAATVFFRSQWALEETRKAYKMDGNNFRVAGLGGFIDFPQEDEYSGGKNILFISREFIPKGGYHCFHAFKALQKSYPEITLTIVGETPPKDVLAHPGVYYAGLLKKNIPTEYKAFRDIIKSAFVLVHPTIKDTNALVLTEVGYYGCPAIATRLFAIPELIKDGETGFLIDVPVRDESIVQHLVFLLEKKDKYLSMRNEARKFSTLNFTWEKVGDFIYKRIMER